jgi:hypothetical protein
MVSSNIVVFKLLSFDLNFFHETTDIWDKADAFQFVKQPAEGDISVEMLVDEFISGGDWWAKGGIMIRDTLDPGSMHYSLFMTKEGNSLQNLYRGCTGCSSGGSQDPSVKDRSVWLKIVKIGNVFEAFFKRIGDTEWAKIGVPKTIDFSSASFYVGIAVTSHDSQKLAELRGNDIIVRPVE